MGAESVSNVDMGGAVADAASIVGDQEAQTPVMFTRVKALAARLVIPWEEHTPPLTVEGGVGFHFDGLI